MEYKHPEVPTSQERQEACPESIKTLGNALDVLLAPDFIFDIDGDVPLLFVMLIAHVHGAVRDEARRSEWLNRLAEGVVNRVRSVTLPKRFDQDRIRRFHDGLAEILDLLREPSDAVSLVKMSKLGMGEEDFWRCISEQQDIFHSSDAEAWRGLIRSEDVETPVSARETRSPDEKWGHGTPRFLQEASPNDFVRADKNASTARPGSRGEPHDWRPSISPRVLPATESGFFSRHHRE